MINWKIRIKNKVFWLTLIPAVLMLAQAVAALFGFQLDFAGLQDKLLNIAETLFAVLVILGIVADPTTDGLADSNLALTYDKPSKGE